MSVKKTNLIATGTVSKNRKARFNYTITETFEAGIVLTGSEVKSLRHGLASIGESYAINEGNEIYLINANIPEYNQAAHFNHIAGRKRKLLLHRKEISKLLGYITRKGHTLVPLSIFFNKRGKAKVELGLGIGKASPDKRDTIKKRDWERDKARIMRSRNK